MAWVFWMVQVQLEKKLAASVPVPLRALFQFEAVSTAAVLLE